MENGKHGGLKSMESASPIINPAMAPRLDLPKIGSIAVNSKDPKGCEFTINISERHYHLRADGKAACKDWVITLNQVKEARIHEVNVKLVMPKPKGSSTSQPTDLLPVEVPPSLTAFWIFRLATDKRFNTFAT